MEWIDGIRARQISDIVDPANRQATESLLSELSTFQVVELVAVIPDHYSRNELHPRLRGSRIGNWYAPVVLGRSGDALEIHGYESRWSLHLGAHILCTSQKSFLLSLIKCWRLPIHDVMLRMLAHPYSRGKFLSGYMSFRRLQSSDYASHLRTNNLVVTKRL